METVQDTAKEKKTPRRNAMREYNDAARDRRIERARKKAEISTALLEAMAVGKSKDWETLVNMGIACPAIMNRVCSSYYRRLPDEYKYLLPVKWYLNGGKCADTVVDAMKMAAVYRPRKWIGAGLITEKTGIDVYIGTRCPIDEVGKEIAWCRSYETAYIDAERVKGKVYKGYLRVLDIIAIDVKSVDNVLQYDSVMGIEQVFPKLPLYLD